MTKPELGTKRLCASCGARFYDLLHTPITCPKCGAVLATAVVNSSRARVKATREPEREFERPITKTSGAQFAMSLLIMSLQSRSGASSYSTWLPSLLNG
jgi:uncharacterized protein (TIGR02300 family)